MLTNKKSERLFAGCIWIAVGVLFGLVIALMVISGSRSLNRFYDGGKVYDVLVLHRTGDAIGLIYDGNEGRFEITEGQAVKICSLSEMEEEWNYIVIELSAVNRDAISCVFEYLNLNGESILQKEVSMTEGQNIIQTEGIAYAGVNIWMNDQIGTTMSFDKIQFREKMVDFHSGKFLVAFAAGLAGYAGITVFLYRLLRRRRESSGGWYRIVEWLQGFYILVGEQMGQRVAGIGEKGKSRLRITLFLFLILYMQVIMDLQLYETDRFYKVQIGICSLVTVAIGVLCYERKLVRINWNNKLVGAWSALWIMACISDFFVAKRYSFSGYMMLFVLGFFYFMWNNMEYKEMIFREFVTAIIISFVITTIFCFVCRPWVVGTRYLGSYYRPGMYGMYVLFVWIALLGDIDCKLNQEKKLFPGILPELVLTALAGMLLWKTQASSGVLPAVLVLVIFSFKQHVLSKSALVKKKSLVLAIAAVLIAVPVCAVGEWGLIHLSGILGTEIKMEEDAEFTSAQMPFEPMQVYAAESAMEESRILKKVFGGQTLEDFTSARNFYWLGYLREMNILGNKNKVKLWGGNRWPHSGFIAMMYRYGVFAVIPYTVMVFMNLIYAWKYMLHNRKEYGFFMFAVMIAAFVLILMENLELPFLYLCWLGMYMMMGINFVQEESA